MHFRISIAPGALLKAPGRTRRGSPSPVSTRRSPLLSSYKHSHTLTNAWQLYCCCQELKGAITPRTIQKIKPADRNSSPEGSPVKVRKETTLQGLPQATALHRWGCCCCSSCQEHSACSSLMSPAGAQGSCSSQSTLVPLCCYSGHRGL